MAKETLEEALRLRLDDRRRRGLLRSVSIDNPPEKVLIDFSSSDYLGLAHDERLSRRIHELVAVYELHVWNASKTSTKTGMESAGSRRPAFSVAGSTGSRLLAGNSTQAVELEKHLCAHYGADHALLFNSGYAANLSLFGSLPQPGDLVLYDELVHASVHDGLRMRRASGAQCRIESFAHNDMKDVTNKVGSFLCSATDGRSNPSGNVIIAVEGVYSMDGDMAPLRELADLAQRFPGRINLVVDEAHSTGVLGASGRGIASDLGVAGAMFARLHTFGKAMGVHGAVVLGSETLISYLANYGRPLIYSTMMSFHSLAAIRASHDLLADQWHKLQRTLLSNVSLFRSQMLDGMRFVDRIQSDLDCKNNFYQVRLLESVTPIQGLVVPGNERVLSLSRQLRLRGFHVLPVRAPSVPVGSERLRICIHAHNTHDEINALVCAIVDVLVAQKQSQTLEMSTVDNSVRKSQVDVGAAGRMQPRL